MVIIKKKYKQKGRKNMKGIEDKDIGIIYEDVLKEGNVKVIPGKDKNNQTKYLVIWEWEQEGVKNHIILGEGKKQAGENRINIRQIYEKVESLMRAKAEQVMQTEPYKKKLEGQNCEAIKNHLNSITWSTDGENFLKHTQTGPTILEREYFLNMDEDCQVQNTKTQEDRLAQTRKEEGITDIREKYSAYTKQQQTAAVELLVKDLEREMQEIEDGRVATHVILAINSANTATLDSILQENQTYLLAIMRKYREELYKAYEKANEEGKLNIMKGMIEYSKAIYIKEKTKAINSYARYIEANHLQEPIYKIPTEEGVVENTPLKEDTTLEKE